MSERMTSEMKAEMEQMIVDGCTLSEVGVHFAKKYDKYIYGNQYNSLKKDILEGGREKKLKEKMRKLEEELARISA